MPGDDLEQAACLFSTEIISLDALAAIAGRLAALGRERFQDGDLPVMCDSQWDEAGICSSPTQGQESVTRGAGVRVGGGMPKSETQHETGAGVWCSHSRDGEGAGN